MNAWRNAGKMPRVFGIDVRGVFPVAFFLLHPRSWTLALAIASIVGLAVLERFGFTVPVFLRWARHRLRGPICHARPWWIRRRFFNN